MKSNIIFFVVALFCLQACQGAQNPLFTMQEPRFNELVTLVKEANFFDTKAQILKAVFNIFSFTCNQAWELLEAFPTDGDRLLALPLFHYNIYNAVNNKQKQLIERFNRTEDRQIATTLLAKITDAKAVWNPNMQFPGFNITFATSSEDVNILIRALERVPNVPSQLKIAELSVMSRINILSPDQAMMLFDVFKTYQDIITLKDSIKPRLAGITVEHLITLINRFSFENQRSLIFDKMQCAPGNVSCSFGADLYNLAELLHFKALENSTNTCNVTIADRFSFEDHKFALLEAFSNLILDIENKNALIDAFSSGCSRDRARNILKNFTPISYVFGAAPTGKVYFVLDVSLSMSASFRYNGTYTQTRYGFAMKEFAKMANQMNESVAFGMSVFADRVVPLNQNLTNATQANIQSAIALSTKFSAAGGTNSHEALRVAMNTPGVQTVILMSDGHPNVGNKTNIDDVVADVKEWSKNGNITVHTIAMLQGTRSDDNKPLAREFMEKVATVTGGTYRLLESEN